MLLIPAVIILGFTAFPSKAYALISLAVTVLTIIPLFLKFEGSRISAYELSVTAILTAFCVAGRIVFAFLPSIKPVAATVIITGVTLGPLPAFTVGSLTAVISDVYFGLGAWTPFQMLAWGFIGFIAGILRKILRKSIFLTAALSGISGFIYSAVLDIWTVIFIDGYFNFPRFIASCAASFPITVQYAISNIVFTLILFYPMKKIISRISLKYGIFPDKKSA